MFQYRPQTSAAQCQLWLPQGPRRRSATKTSAGCTPISSVADAPRLAGRPTSSATTPPRPTRYWAACARPTLELVQTTVRTAAEAWPKWRNTPAPSRGRVLLEVARLMDKHREELARLISLEEGKADQGLARRSPAQHQHHRVHVRRRATLRRLHVGVRVGHQVRLHDSPAAGRGRVHHALELSAGHPGLENRAGAGRRATR